MARRSKPDPHQCDGRWWIGGLRTDPVLHPPHQTADGNTGGTNGEDHGYWAGHLAAPNIGASTLGATSSASSGNNWAAAAIELLPA